MNLKKLYCLFFGKKMRENKEMGRPGGVVESPASARSLPSVSGISASPALLGKRSEMVAIIFRVGGKLKLATLGNLQSLVNVGGADCDLTHLAELTNLRKLLIRAGLENMEEMLKSNGITSNHLRSLSLFVYSVEVIPMNKVLSCPHVYKLQLEGRIREQSLEGLQGYKNLTKMSLSNTRLRLGSLKILERIPNLRMLWLNLASIDQNVSGVVVSEEGYPNLEFLELLQLWGLKSWSIEKGGMPSLCRLSIGWCWELRAVPEGLENVTTLKELTINRMPREFCTRVGEGGEDFYKIQHVPSLLITNIKEDREVDN